MFKRPWNINKMLCFVLHKYLVHKKNLFSIKQSLNHAEYIELWLFTSNLSEICVMQNTHETCTKNIEQYNCWLNIFMYVKSDGRIDQRSQSAAALTVPATRRPSWAHTDPRVGTVIHRTLVVNWSCLCCCVNSDSCTRR